MSEQERLEEAVVDAYAAYYINADSYGNSYAAYNVYTKALQALRNYLEGARQ